MSIDLAAESTLRQNAMISQRHGIPMPWHPNTTDFQLIESGTQRAFGLPSPNIHSGRAKDCRCIFRGPASVIFLERQLFLEMQQYKWVLKVECLIDLINQ